MPCRRKLLTLILFITATGLTACVAKNVVSRVSPATGTSGRMKGVFYALPRTVTIVSVPVKKTQKEPGEFMRFARCFFPNEDPIMQKESEFSVGTPAFTTRGEPDPTKVFMVSIQGKYLEDKALQMDLTDSGLLVKGEMESKNMALDFATKAVKTAISIGAQAAGVGLKAAAADRNQSFRETLNARERQCYDAYVTELEKKANSLSGIALTKRLTFMTASRAQEVNKRALRAASEGASGEESRLKIESETASEAAAKAEQELNDVLNTAAQEIAIATSRGEHLTAQLQAIEEFIKARNDVDDFERAKETFDKIAKLHGQRDALLSTANTAPPVETLTAMLKEIDETIETLQSKFLGSTKEESPWVPTFEVTPGDNEVHSIRKLFDLSKANGVCELPFQFAHLVVPPKFRKKDGSPCDGLTEVFLRLDKGRYGSLESQLSDTVTAANFSQAGERGFYYRIPAVALARVEIRQQQGASSEMKTIERGRETLSIAQLGTIASLPASSNGRTTKYTLELSPESGALKSFNLGSSALIQNTMLDDIAGAATSVNDLRTKLAAAKANEKAAAAAKSDQLTQLQRASAILELQVKIKELEEKLKEPAP